MYVVSVEISLLWSSSSALSLQWFFSKEDKILIKNLRQLKGYTAVRFLREFESKNWTKKWTGLLVGENLLQWIRWSCVWQWSSPHCSCYWQRHRYWRNDIKPRRQVLHPPHCTADCSRVWHSSVKHPLHHQDRPAAQVFKEVQCSSTHIC